MLAAGGRSSQCTSSVVRLAYRSASASSLPLNLSSLIIDGLPVVCAFNLRSSSHPSFLTHRSNHSETTFLPQCQFRINSVNSSCRYPFAIFSSVLNRYRSHIGYQTYQTSLHYSPGSRNSSVLHPFPSNTTSFIMSNTLVSSCTLSYMQYFLLCS